MQEQQSQAFPNANADTSPTPEQNPSQEKPVNPVSTEQNVCPAQPGNPVPPVQNVRPVQPGKGQINRSACRTDSGTRFKTVGRNLSEEPELWFCDSG